MAQLQHQRVVGLSCHRPVRTENAPPVSRRRAAPGTVAPRSGRRPGTRPAAARPAGASAPGRSARPCPAQRSARSAGGWRQHVGSGQRDFGPLGGLPPAEPLDVRVRHADGHRELALRASGRRGRAPVGAGRRVGVLVVRRGQVGPVEDDPRGPVPADRLALDRPGRVRRELHAVVLVRLVDRSRPRDPHEVHRDAEVAGGQVGEPVRGGLVGHRERVAQVLDRDVLGGLRPPQEVDRAPSRGSAARRRSSWSRPAGAGSRRSPAARVAEHDVAERLQHQRARVVLPGVPLRQVDAAGWPGR